MWDESPRSICEFLIVDDGMGIASLTLTFFLRSRGSAKYAISRGRRMDVCMWISKRRAWLRRYVVFFFVFAFSSSVFSPSLSLVLVSPLVVWWWWVEEKMERGTSLRHI